MSESETRAAVGASQIHAEFVEHVAEGRDLEGKLGIAFKFNSLNVVRGIGAEGDLLPLRSVETQICAQSGWQGVARKAGVAKRGLSELGIAVGQRRAGGKSAAAQSKVAGQREIGGECVAELPITIGSEADGSEEILEFLHLTDGQTVNSALKIGERAVELLDTVAIASPMKRLVGDDVLKCLGDHRPFHRVKVVGDGWRERAKIKIRIYDFGDTRGVAEVPGQAIESGIHVA